MRRSPRTLAAALLALVAAPPFAAADPQPVAVLRALDKVTARTTTLDAPVGETVRFNTLAITARVCDKAPPEEKPESQAYLEIEERKPGQPPKDVFRGWMFASSPGLSAMEHPVYDVWLLDCSSAADSAASHAPGAGAE